MKTFQNHGELFEVWDTFKDLVVSRKSKVLFINGVPTSICKNCKGFKECSDWIKYPEHKCAICSKLKPHFKYLYRVSA